MPVKMTLASDLPDEPDFPLLASYKYDGVRASIQESTFYQRSLKPIVNEFTQAAVKKTQYCEGLDGELIVGKPNEEATFRRTTGAVRRKTGEPDFKFYVFDIVTSSNRSFRLRQAIIRGIANTEELPDWVVIVEQTLVNNMDELNSMAEEALYQGYEGLVLRDPECLYKHGRATAKQGQFMRVVPWARAEGEVIGFEEQLHNTNEATKNELGRTTRSTNKENMIPNGKLGAFILRDLTTGVEFKVGNGDGMTHKFREDAWKSRHMYLGQLITYRHKTVGGYDKPRQAQYVGVRSPDDLGGD